MALDLSISQLLVIADAAGPKAVARSTEFPFAWEDAALTACVRFGRRPLGVACPEAIFAVQVGKTHVAVVQVADQPGHDSLPLGFRFLIFDRKLYEALGGDPFLVADRFPPSWSKRGELELLHWLPEASPRRLVEDVQTMLKRGDTSLLLGGTQALLDGSRVLVAATDPAAGNLVRDVWKLLPERSRWELWPATFAFSVELGFHIAVLPELPTPFPEGHLTADQARDYPEGRYELALQTAIEAGDQAELERLFARRSSSDTLRLAATLFAMALVIAVVSKLMN